MFALRQVIASNEQRLVVFLSQQIARVASSKYHGFVVATLPSHDNSVSALNGWKPLTPTPISLLTHWVTSVSDVLNNAFYNMVSTVKRRRRKMNVHKLKKRRKRERRRTKNR